MARNASQLAWTEDSMRAATGQGSPMSVTSGLAGATLDGGVYVIASLLRSGPGWSVHRGLSRRPGTPPSVLITVADPRARCHAQLAAWLELPFPGVAPLLHIGPVQTASGEWDGMVEAEPPGTPLAFAAPLSALTVTRLIREIGPALAAIERSGITAQCLAPEEIYVSAGPDGLAISGLVPRAGAFVATATPPG